MCICRFAIVGGVRLSEVQGVGGVSFVVVFC